ncbi:MAG: glutaredoxin family protein [Firmicutes bacterium]|nr:glutaredoxin family protein [Bacillota bacterium]
MIELYVKDGCAYCQKQIKQLEQEGLSYRLFNVSHDSSALETAKVKYGAGIVPVLVEDGKVKSIGYQGKG